MSEIEKDSELKRFRDFLETAGDRTKRMVKKVDLDANVIDYANRYVPDKVRALFLRVSTGVSPKSHIIKAKCQHCVGYEDMTARIGECKTWRCPLWAYRPYQGKEALDVSPDV